MYICSRKLQDYASKAKKVGIPERLHFLISDETGAASKWD